MKKPAYEYWTQEKWEEHVAMVNTNMRNKVGSARKVNEFLAYYRRCYDKFKRPGLDYKLAFLLYKDLRKVRLKSAMRWYGIVGPGGTGKSTLAKNLAYFLDNNFTYKNITDEMKEVVQILYKTPITGSFKAILVDEPDMEIHANSSAGKMLRNTFGKVRQQQIFMLFCATDLRDIPPFIFGKLDTIMMTPRLREIFVIRNDYERYLYPLSDIRTEYMQKNYGVFFSALKLGYALRFCSYNFTPLSIEDERRYKDNKEKDLRETQGKTLRMMEGKDGKGEKVFSIRLAKIKELMAEGKSKEEIGKVLNISARYVLKILEKETLGMKAKGEI